MMWRGMSAAEKQPYYDRAAQLTVLHKSLHPGYKYNPIAGRCPIAKKEIKLTEILGQDNEQGM